MKLFRFFACMLAAGCLTGSILGCSLLPTFASKSDESEQEMSSVEEPAEEQQQQQPSPEIIEDDPTSDPISVKEIETTEEEPEMKGLQSMESETNEVQIATLSLETLNNISRDKTVYLQEAKLSERQRTAIENMVDIIAGPLAWYSNGLWNGEVKNKELFTKTIYDAYIFKQDKLEKFDVAFESNRFDEAFMKKYLQSFFPAAELSDLEQSLDSGLYSVNGQWVIEYVSDGEGAAPRGRIVKIVRNDEGLLEVYYSQYVLSDYGNYVFFGENACVVLQENPQSIFDYSIVGYKSLDRPIIASIAASSSATIYTTPDALLDEDETTAWVSGESFGSGDWIELNLASPQTCYGVLINSAWFDQETYDDSQFSRLKDFRFVFPDGTAEKHDLSDPVDDDGDSYYRIVFFDKPQEISILRIAIDDVYYGTTYTNVAISNLQIF